jgi:hypothetical protein
MGESEVGMEGGEGVGVSVGGRGGVGGAAGVVGLGAGYF